MGDSYVNPSKDGGILFGFQINPDRARSKMERGPPAEDKAAVSIRIRYQIRSQYVYSYRFVFYLLAVKRVQRVLGRESRD